MSRYRCREKVRLWVAKDNALVAAKSSAACWVEIQWGHGKKRIPMEASQIPTKKVPCGERAASAKYCGSVEDGVAGVSEARHAGRHMERASRVARVKASGVREAENVPKRSVAYGPAKKGWMRRRGWASQTSLPRSRRAFLTEKCPVAKWSHCKTTPAWYAGREEMEPR